MVIAAALGPNISNSILAMAIIWWPNYARLTRSIVISVKENDYVTASRILGASHLRSLYREILPNSVGPMAVMATLDLGNAILMFSGLSFLGLGVQPPMAEWGAMVSDGVLTFNYWWISTFPGLAIFMSPSAPTLLVTACGLSGPQNAQTGLMGQENELWKSCVGTSAGNRAAPV